MDGGRHRHHLQVGRDRRVVELPSTCVEGTCLVRTAALVGKERKPADHDHDHDHHQHARRWAPDPARVDIENLCGSTASVCARACARGRARARATRAQRRSVASADHPDVGGPPQPPQGAVVVVVRGAVGGDLLEASQPVPTSRRSPRRVAP